MDILLNQIVESCIISEDLCIPKTTNKLKGNNIPGWNDFVKGAHKEALY